MPDTRSLVTRLSGSSALAAMLCLVVVGGTAAQTGQTGNYLFTDTMDTPGAVCRYERISDSNARIYRINVKPPKVWWPNTSSDSNTQHGMVGWRAFIDHGTGGTWTLLKKTDIQKAIAYEDYPNPYDEADKAPFTARKVDVSASSVPVGHHLRVRLKALWYRANGEVLGSVSHTVYWYLLRIGPASGFPQSQACPRNIYSV